MVGQHCRNAGISGVLQPVNLLPRNRWREEARAALAAAGLGEHQRSTVGSLPYGVQKRIELVRALMARPRAPPARRAGRRAQPGGDRGAAEAARSHLRGRRPDPDGGRARHAFRRRAVRGGDRARFRPQDRRGQPRGDPPESGLCRRPISASRGRTEWSTACSLQCMISTSATAASMRCAASRSSSPKARWSRCSAPTAPANRRCCARCWGLRSRREAAVLLDGRDVTHWSTSARVRSGLVLVPEGRRIVMTLTIHENLLMGAFNRRDSRAVAAEIADIYERFPNLAARRHHPASVLSGGEQQMLAIGRGLIARPKVMMLDEPSLGLSPRLSNEVFALIGRLNRERGQSILLVEQNIHRALGLAHRAYVLELGRIAMEGPPDRILADRVLRDAYLGQGPRVRYRAAGASTGAIDARPHRASKSWFEQRRSTMKTRLAILAATFAALVGGRRGRPGHPARLPAVGGGPYATFSKTNEIGAQIAIDEINAAGGIAGKKLRIVAFDTAGKPDQAVVGLRKLADDDKVLAVIGPLSSSECRVVFPAGDRAGIVTHVDGLFGAATGGAVPVCVPQHLGRRLHVRARDACAQAEQRPDCDRAVAYATDDVISKVMGENVLPGVMKKHGTDVKLSVTFQTAGFRLLGAGVAARRPADRPDRGRFRPRAGDAAGAGTAAPGSQGPAGCRLDHRRSRARTPDGQGRRRHHHSHDLLFRPQRPRQGVPGRVRQAREGGRPRPHHGGAVRCRDLRYRAVLRACHEAGESHRRSGPSSRPSARPSRTSCARCRTFPRSKGAISFGTNGDALKPVYAIQLQDAKWTLIGQFSPRINEGLAGRAAARIRAVAPERAGSIRVNVNAPAATSRSRRSGRRCRSGAATTSRCRC